MDDADNRAFDQYRLLMIHRFDRLDDQLKTIEKRLSLMEVDLVRLQIKAGLWGALAGALPAAVAAFLLWVRNAY